MEGWIHIFIFIFFFLNSGELVEACLGAAGEEFIYEEGIFFVFYPAAHCLGLPSLGGVYLFTITRLGLLAHLVFACPTLLA